MTNGIIRALHTRPKPCIIGYINNVLIVNLIINQEVKGSERGYDTGKTQTSYH